MQLVYTQVLVPTISPPDQPQPQLDMAETMLPVLVGSSVVALALQSRVLYLVVTGLGCYALLNGAMVGFEGPAENAFVFGMALAGLVVKLYNYMYLIEPDKLQRKTAGDAVLSDDCRVGKLHEASSSPNLVAKALRVRSTLWDAFELVISSRGIGWYVFRFCAVYQCCH